MDRDTLKRLMQVSHMRCSSEEQEALMHDFKSMIGHFDLLNEIDTHAVLPCYTPLEGMESCMREDSVSETIEREAFLKNTLSLDGMVRLPPRDLPPSALATGVASERLL